MLESYRILDFVPVGACVIDAGLCIVHWNQRFQDWTDFRGCDVVGRVITEVFPRLAVPKYQGRIRGVLKGGPPVIFSAQLHGHVIPCPLPNGELRVQNTTVSHYVDEHGQSSGALFIAEDVTELFSSVRTEGALRQLAQREVVERRKAEAELKVLASDLERHNRSLDDFASTVSHDLKAPLRHISSFSEILMTEYRDHLDADGIRFLDRISRASDTMKRLVSGVLEYSRVTTQAHRSQDVAIAEVLDDVAADLEPELQACGGQIVYPDELPVLHGDRTQFRQLFMNLIGNSLKFARDGVAPAIAVGLVPTDHQLDGEPVQCIRVTDNGIGFEPGRAAEIFRMCRRLHADTAFEGSGIGLAIVKRVVERHFGEIEAIGRPGQGAEFRLYFPNQERMDSLSSISSSNISPSSE